MKILGVALICATCFLTSLCYGQGVIFWYDGRGHIISMKPNDKEPEPVLDATLFAASPDGNLLLFTTKNLNPTVAIFDIRKGQIREKFDLKHPSRGTFDWSANGNWIAYIGEVGKVLVNGEVPREVIRFRPNGTQFKRLTFDGGRKFSVCMAS